MLLVQDRPSTPPEGGYRFYGVVGIYHDVGEDGRSTATTRRHEDPAGIKMRCAWGPSTAYNAQRPAQRLFPPRVSYDSVALLRC